MKIKEWIKRKFVKVKKEKVLIPTLFSDLLSNRYALITGGSSGIGFAIAESFIKSGAKVTICGRNEIKLKAAQEELCKRCNCTNSIIETLVLDISNISEMKSIINEYLKDHKIDIFVNNAGVNGSKVFPNTTEIEYNTILNTNLKGMYFFSQEIAKYMIENKIEGNILNITSCSSLRPAISPYIISKWGEKSLTLGLAKKYIPYNIVVNGLAPGSTLTPMLKEDNDDLDLEWSPIKRYAAPEEIGNLAVVLVSDLGRLIIGDTIYASGGAGLLTFDDTSY